MSSVRALLKDRKRSQRGSVLSAVLIITAFLAIISGALMTELSTNLLLSRNLVNRVATEATVNSALEVAMNRLATTSITAGCPAGVTQVTINGHTAASSYTSCWLTVHNGEQQFTSLAGSSAPFKVDGTHAMTAGLNDYIVGDSAGTIFDSAFGQTSRWSVGLGGSVSAPLTAFKDASESAISYVVPVNKPTAASSGCDSSQPCVALLSAPNPGATPVLRCYMPTSKPVVAAPAQGVNNPRVVFFGDATGMYAFDATDDGNCASMGTAPSTDGDDAVLAGPVVFPGPDSSTDALYVVVGDGSSSLLARYSYTSGGGGGGGGGEGGGSPALTLVGSIPLPAASAKGITVDGSALPARLAISFGGGQVAMVQIGTNFNMALLGTTSLPEGISDAPYWCHCAGPTNVIGVGGKSGGLYLLDASLNRLATLPAGGSPITTTPQSDGHGDWFFGAKDGSLYEAQQQPGPPTNNIRVVAQFGPAGGAVASGAQIGSCGTHLCVYVGSLDSSAYLTQLDARAAVVTACLTTAPPACSGQNPRLWASVEVGALSSANDVRIQGWSYYSP